MRLSTSIWSHQTLVKSAQIPEATSSRIFHLFPPVVLLILIPDYIDKMSETFMLRSDYAEKARAVHSACGAMSTVFLSIRLWARKAHAKGLWWVEVHCVGHKSPGR